MGGKDFFVIKMGGGAETFFDKKKGRGKTFLGGKKSSCPEHVPINFGSSLSSGSSPQ